VIFPGCAARAALKATLEKGPTERWIIGSNDVAAIIDSRLHGHRPKDAGALDPCVASSNDLALIVPEGLMRVARLRKAYVATEDKPRLS
jgi:hypothetical protein